ncbi:MAG: hypothetical protein ACREO0_07165 [Pseudoxanthomonas sp.]
MAAKKKTKSKVQETTLRHLWLAGLGVAAVARRETLNAANDAVAKVVSLKKQAGKLADEAQANVLGGIASVREQGEATASRFSADVEARLAPVLVKLGLKPKAKKTTRGRKTAKKTVVKRARATPARKPAAKRAVRRTRG